LVLALTARVLPSAVLTDSPFLDVRRAAPCSRRRREDVVELRLVLRLGEVGDDAVRERGERQSTHTMGSSSSAADASATHVASTEQRRRIPLRLGEKLKRRFQL
jgi:hypothetical protein